MAADDKAITRRECVAEGMRLGGLAITCGALGALATRSVGRPVVRARPRFMSDVEATAAIAGAALDLARELAGELAPDRTPA